jgi:hypothetical protein
LKRNKSRWFKSFSFWFVVLSALVIVSHQIGRDPKSIVLISLNPILNLISDSEAGRQFMNLGPKIAIRTIIGEISIYWYIGSLVSFLMYGLLLDGLKRLLRVFS